MDHTKPLSVNNKRKFSINDLPLYSSWPSRLMGLEAFGMRYKTSSEIIREFEKETWGPLLRKVKQHRGQLSIHQVDQWLHQRASTAYACVMAGELELLTLSRFHRKYLNLIESTLKMFLPSTALVELGCGYGSIILNIARRKAFIKMKLMAADYVPSARELTEKIACKQGKDIQVGYCDLGSSGITDLPIPPGAVIFTSYAAMYVPRLSGQFIATLLKFKPRAVVHFEPCYEHFDPRNLLGLMKHRYVELNDYNKNLVSLLHRQQDMKRIKILKEEPDIIGNNVLCPASLIIWEPKSR
jgi:hypothetical protein